MADKGGLQLLPETRKRLEIKIPGENRLLYIGSALIVLALLLGLGGRYYNQTLIDKIMSIDTQIMELEKERDKKAEENLLIIDKQIGLISELFNDHIFWSKGLDLIGNNLQNRVQFKSFTTGSGEGKITFRAGADSYSTVARQIASFISNEAIEDVALENVNVLTNGTIEFNMTLNYDSSKFLKQNAK